MSMMVRTVYRAMPPELMAQDEELNHKQMDALDRYDFAEALVLFHQQNALRDSWDMQVAQENELVSQSENGD
jgi:hypothetical protein